MPAPKIQHCTVCAERARRDREAASTQFARTVLVAAHFAAERRAERVEFEDVRRAVEHVRRETQA
jgi:hypothetical protein